MTQACIDVPDIYQHMCDSEDTLRYASLAHWNGWTDAIPEAVS